MVPMKQQKWLRQNLVPQNRVRIFGYMKKMNEMKDKMKNDVITELAVQYINENISEWVANGDYPKQVFDS